MRLVQYHVEGSHYHRAANMTPVALQHTHGHALTSTPSSFGSSVPRLSPETAEQRHFPGRLCGWLEERHKRTAKEEINL